LTITVKNLKISFISTKLTEMPITMPPGLVARNPWVALTIKQQGTTSKSFSFVSADLCAH